MTTENFNVAALKETPPEGHGSAPGGPAATPAPGAATTTVTDKPPGETPAKTPEQIQAEATAAAEVTAIKKKQEEGAALTDAEKETLAKAVQPASTPATNASPANTGKPLSPEEIKALATKEILAQAGVDTLDQLMEKLKPKVELSDAEKLVESQKYEANVDHYAVSKGLMTREDLVALANVQKADNITLARNEFTKDFKATKADATDVEIDQAFKLFYNLESSDEAMKAYGQKMIDQKAGLIKGELVGKRDAAKQKFDAENTSKSKVPGFASEIQKAIKANVPEEIVLHADGDNKPVFKITPEVKVELEKFLARQDLFDEYVSAGATQQLSDKLKDSINGFLFLQNKEAMFKTVWDAAINVGTKKGSTTGATASFNTKGDGTQSVAVDVNEKELSPADKEKLGKVFKGVNG